MGRYENIIYVINMFGKWKADVLILKSNNFCFVISVILFPILNYARSLCKCKITVMRKACYKDLMEKYENPMEHACDIEEGQVFIANGWCKPVGMCDSAWESMSPFVMTLAYGGKDIYNGWMKNEKSAMISCNDGFRPVSFLIEALEEEAD